MKLSERLEKLFEILLNTESILWKNALIFRTYFK